MKIINTQNLIGTERDVRGVGFNSLRILLASDNMGFSLHETRIDKGGPYHWHYKEHLEACYCISGCGLIHNLTTDEIFNIFPGVTYVLNDHDNHTFTASEPTVLISVFNPPVSGQEIHGEDGSYSLPRNMNYAKAHQIVKAVNSTCSEYDATELVQDILNGKQHA